MNLDDKLKRADQLMDAQPGTPEGAELDRLADEIVEAEKDVLAPDPTCTRCGATVRVLSVEPNGWINLEAHVCTGNPTP